MNSKLSNKIKLISILFLSILLLILFLASLNNEIIKCSFVKFDNKDICYYNLALSEPKLLNKIKSPALIDYYNLKKGDCSNINNFYLKNQCYRLEYRPHMWIFINQPNINENLNLDNFNICSNKVSYDKLLSIYDYAFSTSKESFSDGKKICDSFQDNKYSGECNYYLQLSLINQIEEDFEIINFIKDHCNDIIHRSWNSECFFQLADALVSIDPTYYLRDIAQSCSNSSDSLNYYCIDHIAQNLEYQNLIEFCNFTETKYESECHFGLGCSISKRNNLSESIELCISNYVGNNPLNCIRGAINCANFGEINMNNYDNSCNSIPQEYQDYCYEIVGFQLGEYTIQNSENANEIVTKCEGFQDSNIELCYFGFSKNLDYITKYSIYESIEICKNMDAKFADVCYLALIENILRFFTIEEINENAVCNIFPQKSNSICINKLEEIKEIYN